MLKLCEDCGQTKPFEPSAPERTKASGFYGWYCWDCHTQNAAVRKALRTGTQSPEYIDLHTQVECFQQKIKELKTRMLKIQQDRQLAAQEARKQARNARPKALAKHTLGLPYGELARTAQIALDTFLEEPAVDHPGYTLRKHNLEYKLEYAQKKLGLFGPDAFDIPIGYKKAKSDSD